MEQLHNKADKKYFYVYNIEQSNFFIANSIPVLKVGRGKQGDFYTLFPRNDKSEEVFSRWVELCNALK